MAYRIVLAPAAERQVNTLRGANRIALQGVILALSHDPQPSGAAKLSGVRDLWRLRIRIDGKPWRVIYRLDSAEQLVLVIRVAARNEGTYRGLP